jgi:hypothetical protein
VNVLPERLLALHAALTEANLPHAFGGAIALGYCTLEPRGAGDLDVNVFVTVDRAEAVFAALPQPIAVAALDLEHAERDGQVRVWWEQTPIDIFFDVLPFHRELASSVRDVAFAGHTIPVVSCNALAVFKATFDRTKHWADIEAMVAAETINTDAVLAWVRQMAGPGSPAARRMAALRT